VRTSDCTRCAWWCWRVKRGSKVALRGPKGCWSAALADAMVGLFGASGLSGASWLLETRGLFETPGLFGTSGLFEATGLFGASVPMDTACRSRQIRRAKRHCCAWQLAHKSVYLQDFVNHDCTMQTARKQSTKPRCLKVCTVSSVLARNYPVTSFGSYAISWGCVQLKPAWYLYNHLLWRWGLVINSCLEGVVLLSKSSDNIAEPFHCLALLNQHLMY